MRNETVNPSYPIAKTQSVNSLLPLFPSLPKGQNFNT